MSRRLVRIALVAAAIVSLGLAAQISCVQTPEGSTGDSAGTSGSGGGSGGAQAGVGTEEELLDQLGLGGDGDADGDGDGGGPSVPTGFVSFTKKDIQQRVFPNGQAVTATTFDLGDLDRTRRDADFNGDDKADLVVGYGEETAVVQILLTQDSGNDIDFLSLTLDGLEIDPCTGSAFRALLTGGKVVPAPASPSTATMTIDFAFDRATNTLWVMPAPDDVVFPPSVTSMSIHLGVFGQSGAAIDTFTTPFLATGTTAGVDNTGPVTLTDAGANFVAAGVTTAHTLRIVGGDGATVGDYTITGVAATVLTLDDDEDPGNATGDVEYVVIRTDNLVLTDAQADALFDHGLYVQFATAALPNGAIRGQISPILPLRETFWGLTDVAVGDIDGDGALDIVCSTLGDDTEKKHAGVWLMRNPAASGQDITDMRYWNVDVIRAAICTDIQDFIDATFGPDVHVPDDFTSIKIEGGYTNVEVGDMDNDDDMDIVAALYFEATYSLGGDYDPVIDKNGLLFVFLNPGGTDPQGWNWEAVPFGRHEREQPVDRSGASGLYLHDLDDDGDLDVINVAGTLNDTIGDNNIQVAWYQNPYIPDGQQHRDCDQTGAGGLAALRNSLQWCQWRIGSLRDAFAVDFGDLTGDGRPDVVASSPDQQQVFLFAQPATGPKREYDWDTSVLATLEDVQPQDVKIADLDGDGNPEVIVGDTNAGIYRYVAPPSGFANEWQGLEVETLPVGGVIGLIGVGDIDEDGDPDLGIVLRPIEEAKANDAQVLWIRTNR